MPTRPDRKHSVPFGLPEASPPAEVVVVRERAADAGFLTVRRVELAVNDGADTSAAFDYDVVERRALDAAVIVAHFAEGGRRWVVLRSCLRPSLAVTLGESSLLWELPAGLIEPGESAIDAAARELNEEVGTSLDADRLRPLGAPVFPAPAMIAERQHLFHVEIDPTELSAPVGDGSALEQSAQVVFVALDDALALARRGQLPDAKTEIGLRRLVEVLG